MVANGQEESEYELQRKRNIEKNKAVMAQLEIASARATEVPKQQRVKRKQEISDAHPHRRSQRTAGGAPSGVAAPPIKNQKLDHDDEAARNRQCLAQGWKIKTEAGVLWRGEVFGSVQGVDVGYVFGQGDYQRQGRQEMSATGFFVPAVQPEWCVPGTGCYALILNNDNGSNTDHGVSCVYVGGGGRHRGQNRTAPQSFDQSWDNVTNASLKLSCDRKLPLRVIRGPKLASKFRPVNGGFRYDGLYEVARAYEGRTASGLRQCLFKLKRQSGQPALPEAAERNHNN